MVLCIHIPQEPRHDQVIIFIVKYATKLLIYFQTWRVQSLKFGGGSAISSSTLPGVWLLIHAGIKVKPCQWKRSLADIRRITRNHIHRNLWHMIIHPFLNFNGGLAQIKTWMNNYIPQDIMRYAYIHPDPNLRWTTSAKEATGTNVSINFERQSTCIHYNDVTMSTMASQIISNSTVYSNICLSLHKKKTSTVRVTDPLWGDPPVTKGR